MMLALVESEEGDCYYSDGNGAPPVVQHEFDYSEKSLDEGIPPNDNGPILEQSKFVILETSIIDTFNVDELKTELEKWSISTTRLKAELKEGLKRPGLIEYL